MVFGEEGVNSAGVGRRVGGEGRREVGATRSEGCPGRVVVDPSLETSHGR